MKYVKAIFVGLFIYGFISGVAAHAELLVEESGSKSIFKVDGKDVTPMEAQRVAATSKAAVERCAPIKDAITFDGKGAFRCKRVALVINPKTGTTKWKSL